MEWVHRGRCWKFGDDVPNDTGIVPNEAITRHIFDRERLGQLCMTCIDPEFPRKARAGDILVAGERFGAGSCHIQSAYALQALGLAVVAESMSRGFLRNGLVAGLLLIPECRRITSLVETGDELEVDFRSGRIANLTRGTSAEATPLPDFLLKVVEAGGLVSYLKAQHGRADAAPRS